MGGVLRAQNQDGNESDISPGGFRGQVYAHTGGVSDEYGFLNRRTYLEHGMCWRCKISW